MPCCREATDTPRGRSSAVQGDGVAHLQWLVQDGVRGLTLTAQSGAGAGVEPDGLLRIAVRLGQAVPGVARLDGVFRLAGRRIGPDAGRDVPDLDETEQQQRDDDDQHDLGHRDVTRVQRTSRRGAGGRRARPRIGLGRVYDDSFSLLRIGEQGGSPKGMCEL